MEIATLPTSSLSPLASIDRYPLTVAPETPLADAIALMSQTLNACRLSNAQPLAESKETTKTSIGCVLVIESDRLVGLLSEGDVVNLTAAEFCLEKVKVAEVMNRNFIAIKESEFVDVFTALNLFCQHSIDYLPIVDDRDRLVGLVTPHSIRQEVAKLQQKQRELLDSNSALEKQVRDLTAQLQQQIKCVSESDRRNRLIAQIASRIRATLNIEDLVNYTVAQVRQVLECDRVLVCQFARDRSGNIIAESVAPGWKKTLGNQVEDTCFFNREKGEYFATGKWICPDISKAGLTDCHLQVLEGYQVKANLAIPILIADRPNSPSRPWGLLLAHQCSGTRGWQESELELLDQLAVQIAIALQQDQLLDRAQAELAQRSLAEAALRDRSKQLKNAENALQTSRTQLSDILNSVTASISSCRVFADGDWESDSELGAATFTDLTYPEDVKADLEQFQQLVEGNISRFGIEKRLIKKNGELMWANLTVTLICDLDGTPLYSMGAIEDISYRKRAECELQQLKERLQLLLASNPAVIFTLQPAGDFATTYISDNVRAIVGYSSQECLADPHFWSSRIHPEDLKQFLVGFANLSGPENRTSEYRFLHRDGLYRWLRTELKLLVNSKGEPIEIIGYAADISNSKCAEIALRQQFEQEKLVEAIARRVRQSLELAEILNTTVAELQQILAVDRVMVYQLLPDGSGKVIAEAVADECSHILDRVFAEEVFSPENYQHYLEGRICAISERDGRDFTPCLVNFMQEIEVKAELVAPIVQLNQLWGLLIAHQYDRPRQWQEWEINLFQQLANQLAIAIQQSLLYQQLQSELNERKQAEENLKNSLKEKEILLKEIHHRVKNNLCVVASLLELQSETVTDSQLAKMLAESQHRLYSMALIHEKLYRSKNLRQINLGEYIEDLVTNLFHSYNINDNRIQLQVFAEPILLNIETATPCGLIVNELVSNTLKHAFPNGTSGTVSVECYQTGDREIHLFVKDNGTGFPKNLDFRKTGSMGFQVICTLTEQLDGTIELSREIGTVFHLKFNELKYFSRL
ncbi:MAG: GAF domain-containing protein [Microcoleus sp. SU_5_3]|nr:GAF domain-containing protein [Microcoleus sp. SU_5_3]